MKLFGWDLQRTRRWRGPRRRLRKGGRARGVKGDAPFDFVRDLVNVAVEHGHRSEPCEQLQRFAGVVGAPAPLRVDRPKRNVRENDDRLRGRAAGEIVLQPCELRRAKIAHPAGLQIGDIDQRDEVHAAMVEAVPAGPHRSLAEAVEEGLAAVRVEHVVLARNEENRAAELLQHLLGVVELVIARELRDVAGVDDEVRLLRQRLDLGDSLPKSRAGIGIGRLVEADMAVAQLDEGERRGGCAMERRGKRRIKADRAADPAVEREQSARPGPRHALQETAAVVHVVVHRKALSLRHSDAMTGRAPDLFPARSINFRKLARRTACAIPAVEGD